VTEHSRITWSFVALFSAAIVAVAPGCNAPGSSEAPDPAGDPQSAVTFTKDVAPIIFANCTPCHQPGQGAPFSLLTFDDVKLRAELIAKTTADRRMPPWPPEPGYASFSNERRLRDDQIDVIRRWVEEGAIEGRAADLTARPPTSTGGWRLGRPDLVVEMPQPYTLKPGHHADVFRNFVIPLTVPKTRYVRAVEFRSGTDGPVIHHAVIGIDRTRASRRLDAQDPEPGYDDQLSGGVEGPDGHFLSWTPGKAPFMAPDGMAWRLDPGTDLVLQLHMLPGKAQTTVRARLGLFFSDAAPTRQPVLIKLGSKAIEIAAGEAAYVVRDEYTLPADVDVLSVYPHAHYLAKDVKGVARLPDGTTKELIWIRDWNFNWQDEYRYARPVYLPRGTTVTMEYKYDNSEANPRNPHRPPKQVRYGPHSSDEMGDLWLQALPRRTGDTEVFARDYVERELRAHVAGAEMRVRAAPLEVESLNWLATSYMRVGRIPEAVPYLQEAVRIAPESAEVHHNLGSAFQAQGRTPEALHHFRAAARLNPRDDRIHLNLANALNASGAVAEAAQHYREVLALNTESAEAHNNLGVALGSQGQIDAAISHFQSALEIQPDYADAHSNLGLAFATRGQTDDAIRSFRRALELRADDENARRSLEALLGLQGRAR
jgi:Tfp pilus assembly protein PilF